jgi:hypothetical protein
MAQRNYEFTTSLSVSIASELLRVERIRGDKKSYRDMKINSLQRIVMWVNEDIEKRMANEEYLEMECVVTGKEYDSI